MRSGQAPRPTHQGTPEEASSVYNVARASPKRQSPQVGRLDGPAHQGVRARPTVERLSSLVEPSAGPVSSRS